MYLRVLTDNCLQIDETAMEHERFDGRSSRNGERLLSLEFWALKCRIRAKIKTQQVSGSVKIA